MLEQRITILRRDLDTRKKESNGPRVSGRRVLMKKLIPLVLGVWVIALVGCTSTETSTTTTTTTRERQQPSATMDPTYNMNRTERMPTSGPR